MMRGALFGWKEVRREIDGRGIVQEGHHLEFKDVHLVLVTLQSV